ncbi:MAG TPA: C13 family peptidase [Longimicrobiaceae bacterium]|nr:C13 family peptidase [Longimicrobiaceae bacterium]
MKSMVLTLVALLATAPAAAAQAHLLIVSGLGGEPKYVNDFHAWGAQMVDAARDRFGLPPENVVFLAEDPARDRERISGESRREAVIEALRAMARRAGEDDRVMILLIGHGSADSRGSRVNLPGPDLTAAELNEELGAFRTQPIVVVNTTSASGDYQEALAGPNRTIITATRSGMEANETLFGGYFVAAFSGEGADSNRDGRVTIAEAFEYARRETEREYTNTGRLQLEHSRMEGDLELAQLFHLGTPSAGAPADASPELRVLYAERDRLQEEVEGLRLRGGQIEAAAYQTQLEALLLDLARTNRAIQEMEGAQ